MKCAKPYMYKGLIPFGCGQCMSCRKNKLRLWQHRLMLEGLKHAESCMLTLTYAPEHLPPNGSLRKKDVQDFLKKLRRQIEPRKIRYYYVGEYGEKTMRPHYHIALFGLGKSSHNLLNSVWGKGLIDTGHEGETGKINGDSASYICGYVTKKLTSKDDPLVKKLLTEKGLEPEFAHMSLKPGIGSGVADDIVNFLTTSVGAEHILRAGDVPMVLNHGGKSWPLGRYIRRLIREKMGFPETGAQAGWEEQSKIRSEEAMLDLCIREGLIGLIKEDEATEYTKAVKSMYKPTGGWRKHLLEESNRTHNEQLSLMEKTEKQKGRPL